jgi:hypothetical protein
MYLRANWASGWLSERHLRNLNFEFLFLLFLVPGFPFLWQRHGIKRNKKGKENIRYIKREEKNILARRLVGAIPASSGQVSSSHSVLSRHEKRFKRELKTGEKKNRKENCLYFSSSSSALKESYTYVRQIV